jgi:YD repeat-containing protein
LSGITRDFFVLDAAGLAFGDYSIDGDHHRSADLVRLSAHQGSVLEHVIGERYRGPRQFSAVKLLQIAAEQGVSIETFGGGSGETDAALARIGWPEDLEERLADWANRGLSVQAPVSGHTEPGLGTFLGFIATDPRTGAGAYIVEFENREVFGGAGDNGSSGTGETGCGECGESGPGSLVHLLSGNYAEQITDLLLPARGLPLVFGRTYNSQLGWSHSYEREIRVEAGGEMTWTDRTGIPWRFSADGSPPPKRFQRIDREGDGFVMRYPDGLVERYDEQGRLAMEEDTNGHQVVLEHDGAGRLSLVGGAGGGFFSLAYDEQGRLVRVTDSAGRVVQLGYDAAGNVVSDRNVLGESRSYVYDSAGRMRERTDHRGNATRMAYDDTGRVVRIEYPDGAVRTYAYDFRNGKTLHVDRTGEPTLYELSDLGQPVRVVDALGNEEAMTYDERGRKTAQQDARGNLTSWTYDADGNVLSTTDPLGATTTFTYGPLSRLTNTTGAHGQTTRSDYDAAGNLVSTTDALGNVPTYAYDDGLPVSITQPGGATTSMAYDPSGNVTAITTEGWADGAWLRRGRPHDIDDRRERRRPGDAGGRPWTASVDHGPCRCRDAVLV